MIIKRTGSDFYICPQMRGMESESLGCLGSICMAWRWKIWREESGIGLKVSKEIGYCGLAGEPKD